MKPLIQFLLFVHLINANIDYKHRYNKIQLNIRSNNNYLIIFDKLI
jgi:hypothetical protein